jgi:hypothetical protein
MPLVAEHIGAGPIAAPDLDDGEWASVHRTGAPLRCPACGHPMSARNGATRHFAHRAGRPGTCAVGDMTAEHLAVQRLIATALRDAGLRADYEAPIGPRRADVLSVRDDGARVCWEVQRSAIRSEDAEARTADHAAAGAETIWLDIRAGLAGWVRPSLAGVPVVRARFLRGEWRTHPWSVPLATWVVEVALGTRVRAPDGWPPNWWPTVAEVEARKQEQAHWAAVHKWLTAEAAWKDDVRTWLAAEAAWERDIRRELERERERVEQPARAAYRDWLRAEAEWRDRVRRWLRAEAVWKGDVRDWLRAEAAWHHAERVRRWLDAERAWKGEQARRARDEEFRVWQRAERTWRAAVGPTGRPRCRECDRFSLAPPVDGMCPPCARRAAQRAGDPR